MIDGDPVTAPRPSPTRHRPTAGLSGGHRRPRPQPLTLLAVGALAVPFAVILIRFAAAGGPRVFLPDDLALIDLHTRAALHWQQSLGPFDRFGWNHPGPAYYYLLSIPYRILGGGAAAAFFGASLINAGAALGVVWVCRRRAGPVPALWAAVCVGALELLLSINSAHAVTYSESTLGAAVSPWTATVIIVPLLLFAVLCAATTAPSVLSALGALLVGSFVVQTDLSTAPLVVVLFLLSVGAAAVVTVRRRRVGEGPPVEPDAPPVAPPPRRRPRLRPHRWRVPALAGLGTALFVVMWIPPLVQNATTHPGNLDLIYRFFTAAHPGHPLSQSLWAVTAVDAVALFGPGEIMSTALGLAPAHAAVAVVALVAVVLVGLAAAAAGHRRQDRFATALGALSLAGLVVMVFAVGRITGLIWGYLVLWEITMPTLAVLGLGAALLGRRRGRTRPVSTPERRSARRPAVGAALAVLAVAIGVVLCVRMVALPPVSTASDPAVGAVTALVTPALHATAGPVFVGDAGLALIDTEEFIGVVNQLDLDGYRPRVNNFWLTEFGTRYIASAGDVPWHVTLLPWSPPARRLRGYVGRVGGIAVTVTGPAVSAPAVTDTGDVRTAPDAKETGPLGPVSLQR